MYPALLMGLLAAPVLLAALAWLAPTPRAARRLGAAGSLALVVPAGLLALRVFCAGPVTAAAGWLRLDALGALHLALMALVFAASALHALVYFGASPHPMARRDARRFASLWFGAYAAMALVLVSDNLGMVWVGVEASTLLTAFLICIPVVPAALEAMWKYLVMCSVGVALAFAGILLLAASGSAANLEGVHALQWTSLMAAAPGLNPALVRVGFIFLVVGFGTKAGLAPLHNWLPDAHSQAPAPVSALFSGFLLNAALYAILRVLPLAEAATGGAGWARGILVFFGLASILIPAAFILAQRDVKRLLAYCSVEHIGIVALGAGLGGLGAFAALFHALNHSLAKTAAFFCAGSLGQACGTHDMRRLTGIARVSRVWGGGLAASLLALIGVAPFAVFFSELLIVKAAWEARAWAALGLFLAGLAIVFAGMSRQAIAMLWEPPQSDAAPCRAGALEGLIVFGPLAALAALGLWMPAGLRAALDQAARVIGGGL